MIFNININKNKLKTKKLKQASNMVKEKNCIDVQAISFFIENQLSHLLELSYTKNIDFLPNKNNYFNENGILLSNFYHIKDFILNLNNEIWENQNDFLKNITLSKKEKSCVNALVYAFINNVDLRKAFQKSYELDEINIENGDFIEEYANFILLLLRLNTLNNENSMGENGVQISDIEMTEKISNLKFDYHFDMNQFKDSWLTIVFERNLNNYS